MNSRSHPGGIPQLDLLGGTVQEPAEVHRLFFALLPDAATRGQLRQAARPCSPVIPGCARAGWTPARYHATVHFLGDHAASA